MENSPSTTPSSAGWWWLLTAEATLLVAAMLFDGYRSSTRGAVLFGVASGQTAALWLWWALAPNGAVPATRQVVLTTLGLFSFLLIAETFVFRIMLTFMMRILVVGGLFCWLRRKLGLVLSHQGEHVGIAPFRIRVIHLLAITLVVALFFSLLRIYDRWENNFTLVLFALTWRAGTAMAPMFAATAALARRRYWPAAAILILLVLAIAGGNAALTESQFSSWPAAKYFYIWSPAESAVVGGSVLGLRAIGYRLTVQRTAEQFAERTARMTLSSDRRMRRSPPP